MKEHGVAIAELPSGAQNRGANRAIKAGTEALGVD
jgi:hypothetical protein